MWWCDAWILISRLTHVHTCSISRPSVESISLGSVAISIFSVSMRDLGVWPHPLVAQLQVFQFQGLPEVCGREGLMQSGGVNWLINILVCYKETTASHPHMEGFPAHVPWNMIEPNLAMVTMGPPLRISTNKRWIQMAMLTHATTDMNSCWPSNPSKSKVLYVSRILE